MRKPSRVRTFFTKGSGLTQQSFAAETNINKIIKRYSAGERFQSPEFAQGDQIYPDYKQAMTVVANAHSTFAQLPSRLRDHFRNSPAEFIRFTSNPNNRTAMIAMGLSTTHLPQPEVSAGSSVAPAKP